MSREKSKTGTEKQKPQKPRKFTDSKTSNKETPKLLQAPKELAPAKPTTQIKQEPKITDNSLPQTSVKETKTEIKKEPDIPIAIQKPATIEVDVINDTTKTKQHKQKIRITLILLMLFYIIGILLGGGIFYRIDTKNTSAISQSEVLAEQVQQTSTPEIPNEQTKEIEINSPAPQITAKAYGVFYKQKKSLQFLQTAEKEADTQLPPASISKLMTALIIVEKYPLSKQIIFPAKCQNIADGTNAGFKTGDILSIQDLLYGMLVASGADASCALSTIDQNTNFINEMNKKAEKLNMTNTKFQNAIGFDAENSQISSVNDLMILVNEILKYNTIRKIVGTEVIEIQPQNTTTVYRITSTNDLLKTIPGTIGIKTGSTPLAGECLAYLYEEKDTEILIIILGSQKRFEDTKTLLNWAKKQKAN